MKFSVWPSYDRSWDETISLARWAEAAGFDGFWYADHLMPFRADGTPDPGDALECWTVLTAVGALVPRVRLVSMVSPVTIHHPVLLAKRAITADHVSGGRVVLGLGAGWQENEHAAYGFDLPAAGPRVDRFEEAIQVVRSLRDDVATTFAGTYYSLQDAPCAPKPTGALPLLVGTGSPRMSRITARWADEWNTWGDPAEVGRRTERFLAACDVVGRDPGTVRRSAQALVFLGKATDEFVVDRSLSGSDEQLVDALNRYVALGVDEFAIPDFTLGETAAARADALAHLHANVLPHVG
jgi:alkanesulfonate monooxygenase SsuD/methylene tetrahydromethanopterin reductase-like flavin-dependent oxidoreductase (luciferase family)